MRRHSILCIIAGAIVSAGGNASAQTAAAAGPTTAVPRVSISMAVFDVNGRSPATTSNMYGADFTHYAYAGRTICQLSGSSLSNRLTALRGMFNEVSAQRAGGGRGSVTGSQASAAPPDVSQPPTDAGFGWRIDGKITSASPSEIVVQIDWQRMWERGEIVNGPRGSTQLALHPGERVPLDSIATIALPGECTGVTLALQVAFASGGAGGRGAAGGVSNVGVGGGGGGGVGGGAGFGRGRGGAGGGTTVSGTGGGGGGGGGAAGGFGGTMGGGVAAGPTSGGRGGGRGGGVASGGAFGPGGVIVSSGFDPQTLQTVDVELWLVHKRPDGTEEAQERSVRTLPGTGEYTFDAVPIATADRSSSVIVSGSVQAQRLADGSEKLFVGIIRRIAVAGEAGYSSTGGSGRTVPMPRYGDVISFEMPDTGAKALAATAASALAVSDRSLNPIPGHEFSVRVRVNR